MYSDSCHPYVRLASISDEAAVEILDFLQVFITEFESRYSRQIQRYYQRRSRRNQMQDAAGGTTCESPF